MQRHFLVYIYLLFFSFHSVLYAQNNHPNILLIIADDLGVDAISGFLDIDNLPATPNLDALRARGITYTNTWATPQCTPTRAAIMSGLYGINTGVMRPPGNLDLEYTSIFNKIKEASSETYTNAVIGKWHISSPVDYNHPAQHGVEHYEGFFNAGVDDYYNWTKVENGQESQEREYVTSHLTDASIDWINNQSKPWFLWLAHAAPHGPFHDPPAELHNQEDTNSQFNKYFAAIEAMDSEIGRLTSSIDEETLANTITIFIGDNGTPSIGAQGFPRDQVKSTLYNGGVRVPMIIAGKGVDRSGEQDDNLTHATDLYATILELTGTQLQGGINNSLSLKPTFSCEYDLPRTYLYSDYEDGRTLGYTIRNDKYKLIKYENGNTEFYNILEDPMEVDDIYDSLNAEEEGVLAELQEEAELIRTSWSCQDGIKNGDEISIDACNNTCSEEDVLSNENIGCCATPSDPSVFYEYINGGRRNIYTNDFPNHDYCFNPNLIPEQTHYNFDIDLNPRVADDITLMTRTNGRPARYFGVAKNGVLIIPIPAQPFIFENPNTGEFNWDWVFEPINNQGDGRDLVALDCSSAHTGPQGYHYHGDMYEYMEQTIPTITTTDEVPSKPVHIGWASDGFPILYRFGPDSDGNLKELLPSFQLKSGLRPGDGILEPCGPYTGKYTKDYEYICGKGDLDECNGIRNAITLETTNGVETFEYFYVITSAFPQISRCLVGTVSQSFENSTQPLTGIDADNDGFITDFDCDDSNAAINPLAIEVEGNDIDENCDGILTSNDELQLDGFTIGPNPSNGEFIINYNSSIPIVATLMTIDGKVVDKRSGSKRLKFSNIQSGNYIIRIQSSNGKSLSRKIIII